MLMISITLTSLFSFDIISISEDNEIRNLIVLTRQYSDDRNGIRATFSIKYLEIFIEESEDLIDIDIQFINRNTDSDWSYDSDYNNSDNSEITPVRYYNNRQLINIDTDTESE